MPPLSESAIYVVEKMAHGFKRSGRRAGGGFYDYASDPPSLWSGLKTFERRSRQLPPEDVRDRLLHAALAATVAADALPAAPAGFADLFGDAVPVDAAAAAARIRALGASTFADRAAALAARFGRRFELPHDTLARLGAA